MQSDSWKQEVIPGLQNVNADAELDDAAIEARTPAPTMSAPSKDLRLMCLIFCFSPLWETTTSTPLLRFSPSVLQQQIGNPISELRHSPSVGVRDLGLPPRKRVQVE